MTLDTRSTRSGDVHIACQVMGDAPQDLVPVPGWGRGLQALKGVPGAWRPFAVEG